jgi:hypothetical protein
VKAFSTIITITLLLSGLDGLAQDKVALVIGNTDYSGKNKVDSCVYDAHDIRDKLKDLDFFVLRDSDNCTLEQQDHLIRQFNEYAKSASMVVFYFSGHAIETNGKNYLCPIDTTFANREDLPNESTDIQARLLKVLDGNGNQHLFKLIILDACRDDPFADKSGLPSGPAYIPHGPGTTIAYAASPGHAASAISPDGIHSLYTGELLNFIGQKELTIHQVIEKTNKAVRAKSHANPYANSDSQDDDLHLSDSQTGLYDNDGLYYSAIPDSAVWSLRHALQSHERIQSIAIQYDKYAIVTDQRIRASKNLYISLVRELDNRNWTASNLFFGPNEEWLITSGTDDWVASANLSKLYQTLNADYQSGHYVQSAAMTGAGWCVTYEDAGYKYLGTPNDLNSYLLYLNRHHLTVKCLAANQQNWIVILQNGQFNLSDTAPQNLRHILTLLRNYRHPVAAVALTSHDGWVVLDGQPQVQGGE